MCPISKLKKETCSFYIHLIALTIEHATATSTFTCMITVIPIFPPRQIPPPPKIILMGNLMRFDRSS